MTGIYKITNKENGKVYIGQTTDIDRRLAEHKQARYVPIDMWINILGPDAFDYEVLEECDSSELDQKEQEYIQKYNSIKSGYNQQWGGFNNSIGSGNGRAKVTEEDVIKIRTAYANHEPAKKLWEKDFKNKITLNQFQAIWQGRSWSHIMPEVFTEENKKWYVSEQRKAKAQFSNDDVLYYRKYYVNHTAEETYQHMLDRQKQIVAKNTFIKMLRGDVRPNSTYLDVPVYKKTLRQWFIGNEPVSTIRGSAE